MANCGVCAAKCSSRPACYSFECSKTEKKCNLNTQKKPTNHKNYKDWAFCMKNPPSASTPHIPKSLNGSAAHGSHPVGAEGHFMDGTYGFGFG